MKVTKSFDFTTLTRMIENERDGKKKRALENPKIKLTPEEKLTNLLEAELVLNVTNAREAERGPGVKGTKKVALNPGTDLRRLAEEGYLSAVAFSASSKSTYNLEVYLSRVLKMDEKDIKELVEDRFPDIKKRGKSAKGLKEKKPKTKKSDLEDKSDPEEVVAEENVEEKKPKKEKTSKKPKKEKTSKQGGKRNTRKKK